MRCAGSSQRWLDQEHGRRRSTKEYHDDDPRRYTSDHNLNTEALQVMQAIPFLPLQSEALLRYRPTPSINTKALRVMQAIPFLPLQSKALLRYRPAPSANTKALRVMQANFLPLQLEALAISSTNDMTRPAPTTPSLARGLSISPCSPTCRLCLLEALRRCRPTPALQHEALL